MTWYKHIKSYYVDSLLSGGKMYNVYIITYDTLQYKIFNIELHSNLFFECDSLLLIFIRIMLLKILNLHLIEFQNVLQRENIHWKFILYFYNTARYHILFISVLRSLKNFTQVHPKVVCVYIRIGTVYIYWSSNVLFLFLWKFTQSSRHDLACAHAPTHHGRDMWVYRWYILCLQPCCNVH
jgi:hypothetical protein